MLTAITIEAATNIEIPIVGSTIADKYIVESITGLGPPDINVVIGDLAGNGGVYQNRRAPQRNPVILMRLNPDYSVNETVDDLRDALYLAMLEPDGDTPSVTVMLHDSSKPDRSFAGIVETFEVAHFAQQPEVQISILCPVVFLQGAAVSAVPSVANTIDVSSLGTAPCGFDMVVALTADMSDFQLKRGDTVLMDIAYDFLNGDILEINTIPGQRVIQRKRGDDWLNIIDKVTDLETWPMFKPVSDTLTLSTSDLTWTSLDYTPQWWGV